MQRIRRIPNKPRFYEATMKGYQLLNALDIKELPVDPFDIIQQNNNWYIHSWSELRKATGHPDPYNLKQNGIEARTQIIRGSNDYMIVYDDSYTNGRLRWTIAHEIGHIILGHLVDFEETALNRGGLTKKKYGVLEVEAHWFAEAILSPNALLHLFNIKEAQEIAFLCDISKDAAGKCEDHLKKFQWNNQPIEFELLRNFYPFFYKDKHRQAIKDGIDKFYGSRLYNDFSKLLRICRNCHGYITDKDQTICHTCGSILPDQETPFQRLPEPGVFYIHSDFLEGSYHPTIDVDENNRVLYCPVCRNHDFSPDASHCKICGSSLINKCLQENMDLKGEYHYCPSCGDATIFENEGLYNHLGSMVLPDLLTYDNAKFEDFIEYEHWDYIIETTYSIEENIEVHSVLMGTKAIRDGDTLVIFTNNQKRKDVVETNTDFIKECIQKYGFAIINTMEVVVHDL